MNAYGNSTTSYASPSSIQIALSRSQSTPFRLQCDGFYSPLDVTVGKIVQSWQRSPHVTSWPTPEDLSRCRCPRPSDGLQIRWPGLLGPEQLLPAEDELLLILRDIGQGVEGVCLREGQNKACGR